ncbi:MAG TPA: VOC family protein [Kofleriaceae bacterium]|nr:VOC family protein [Kofleriaceae bacterium]
MDVLINIDVDDLARAETFYTAAFGLTPGRRFGGDGLELLGASSRIYLLAKAAGTAATATGARRDYARHWTPVHLDVVVDRLEDVDAAVARACAAGAVLEQPAADASWGRIAMLADPFGHGVCVLAFTAAGYDAIAT